MIPTRSQFLPPLRYNTLDNLRLVNKAFKEAVDKAMENHPAFHQIKLLRQMNFQAASLRKVFFSKEVEEEETPGAPLSLSSLPQLKKIAHFGKNAVTDIAKAPMRLAKRRSMPLPARTEEQKEEELFNTYINAVSERFALTPILKQYEMERFIIDLCGGGEVYSKLPHLHIPFDLIHNRFPTEKLTSPVTICTSKYDRKFIALKMQVSVREAHGPHIEEIFYIFEKTKSWKTHYIAGRRDLLGIFAAGLVCLFNYDTFSVNIPAYLICRKYMPQVVAGKPIDSNKLLV